jgi:hypothetical protein
MAMRWLLVVTKAGGSQQSPIICEGGKVVKEPHGICQDREKEELWEPGVALPLLFPKTGRWNFVRPPLPGTVS